ncbi:MAG TPA: DUF4390 domain-containing protein [Gammaproteobacteria bacterium]|nr:DUF4390 domain-containing protein [Gammaproteobacteria bacterium]
MSSRLPTRLLAVLLLAWAGLAGADDGGIVIRSGSLHERDGVYYMSAVVDYHLSAPAREALDNGVPLVMELDIQVLRKRWWWWNEVIAELAQRYRMQYHALSERYVLTAVNSGESRSFHSLHALLDALGNVRGLPIIDAGLLDSHEHYQVRMRAALDIDSLPRPLRTVAYISPGWRLVSDWRTWSLGS